MSSTVYVHIGLGKTGTSTIQKALEEQREPLAGLGIHVPGEKHHVTRRAVYDLMGRRIGGGDAVDNAKVSGAWQPFAESVVSASEPTVVFSEEMLALARPKAVKRLVRSLSPRRVVVVVTVRDLGRVLGSYWQQMVVMGRTEPLAEFLQSVRDPATGPASAGVGFWLRQDLIRTLNAWETAVPREDVRVVTLPAPGQPADLLNDRFAEVIGAPAGLLRARENKDNASVGMAEVEVLRRLNVLLAGDLSEKQRLHLMRVIRAGLVGRESTPIRVPASEYDWINDRASELVGQLRTRGYDVVGSLDDLLPSAPSSPVETAVEEAAVADAALAALAAVSRDEARLWIRNRRRQRSEKAPGGHTASELRARSFRLKTKALEKADDNKLLGWAARTYLKRTSGR